MAMTDHSHIALCDREEPMLLAWPTQGNAGGFVRFEKAADWRAFVESLGIDTRIPEIVRAKFARAQTLYLLGWVDFSIVKAGELAALIALELALMDCEFRAMADSDSNGRRTLIPKQAGQ